MCGSTPITSITRTSAPISSMSSSTASSTGLSLPSSWPRPARKRRLPARRWGDGAEASVSLSGAALPHDDQDDARRDGDDPGNIGNRNRVMLFRRRLDRAEIDDLLFRGE